MDEMNRAEGLNESQRNFFEQHGWLQYDHFLPENVAAQLRELILSKSVSGALRQAGIGKDQNYTLARGRRGDFIEWIDPLNSTEPVQVFLRAIDEVMTSLNRNFFLGLKSLESHLTCYPENTKYERHSDRHRSGSPRVVSFVLYLNPDWKSEHGGRLIIYPPDRQEVCIEPQFARLVLFLSELEHEVEQTAHPRLSITGWMRNTEGI